MLGQDYQAFTSSVRSQAIQTARMEKNMTQKDLAQKTNEKPSVIQDYESGKAIPNPQILGKFERILGVKLRGRLSVIHNLLSAEQMK